MSSAPAMTMAVAISKASGAQSGTSIWVSSTGSTVREAAGAGAVRWPIVRITMFRGLMAEEFGRIRGETLAADHVLGALGGRTANQAIENGVPVKDVWRAVCAEFSVPPQRR